MAVTQCKWATMHACKLNILVPILSILMCAFLLLTMFFMFSKFLNTFFFEFYHWSYLIKDLATRNLLIVGKCKASLYPFKPFNIEFLKQALVSYPA
jgi:hypothetical protein